MQYHADSTRYEAMPYRRVGQSGLHLPALSLGLWQNFGETEPLARAREVLYRAFDRGISHFDLANNYGPPYGSAETTFGRVIEVYCDCPPERAARRFLDRQRHPGHLDHLKDRAAICRQMEALNVGYPLVPGRVLSISADEVIAPADLADLTTRIQRILSAS